MKGMTLSIYSAHGACVWQRRSEDGNFTIAAEDKALLAYLAQEDGDVTLTVSEHLT
jgi:hypothetical protein